MLTVADATTDPPQARPTATRSTPGIEVLWRIGSSACRQLGEGDGLDSDCGHESDPDSEQELTQPYIFGSANAASGAISSRTHRGEVFVVGDQVLPSPASSSALSRARSLVVARRIARSISGTVNREKPDGLPRLRSVILVAPFPSGSQV